jgi:predicted  nucleic acid-binding Zn-ribbon protein
MASVIIGHTDCPECDGTAQVKQSDKCLFRYCPDCHTQTFAKTERQQANMRKRMRPVAGAAPAPAAAAPAPVNVPPTGSGQAKPPAPAPARRGRFVGW